MGEAVQITRLNDDNKIAIDCEAIDRLFANPEVKHAPICIYSIAGPLRLGKSFFCSLMVQYLEHKSRNKVAVFLMDTQGLFDEQNSQLGDMHLFTLSAFLSSHQIYNLGKIINTNDLKQLQMFCEFYEKVVKKTGKLKTPQSLLFVLRDWQDRFYKFGHEGGKSYLKTKYEKSAPEFKSMYLKIQETFATTECALMPHPGFEIAELGATDPVPELGAVRGTFLDICGETFQLMFENPIVKTMNEQPLTGTDIANLAYTISHLLEKKKFGVDIMYQAQASANLQNILSQCEMKFLHYLTKQQIQRTQEELRKYHSEAVETAMKEFDSERKIGNPVHIEQTRTKLCRSLKDRYFMFQCHNEYLKIDVKENQAKLGGDCVNSYMESFSSRDYTVMDGEEFMHSVEIKKLVALAKFKPPSSQQNDLEIEIWKKSKKRMEAVIKAKTDLFRLKNDLNELKLDTKLREAIMQALGSFEAIVKKNEVAHADMEKLIKCETKKLETITGFKFKPTLPVVTINKKTLRTFLEDIAQIYKERMIIEKAIVHGDVDPLTFAKVQKIVASHGEICSDSMPPILIDRALESIPPTKKASVYSTVDAMCKNEWYLQNFNWKREKDKEKIKALETQVSAVDNMITSLSKSKSYVKILEDIEKEKYVFEEKLQSITEESFVEERTTSIEKISNTAKETCKAEQDVYEDLIGEKLNNFLTWTIWKCCQEINEHLHSVSAKQEFMDNLRNKMKSKFADQSRKFEQNDKVHAKYGEYFRIAIDAQMIKWEKINQFHREVFPRMTGWGEFLRSAKHFLNYRISYKLPEWMQKPAEVLNDFFTSH